MLNRLLHTLYCSTLRWEIQQWPVLPEMLRPNSTQVYITKNDPMVSSTSWDAMSKQHSAPPLHEQSNGVQYFLRCYVQTALSSTSPWTIQLCLVLPEMLRPNSTQIYVTMNNPMVSSTPWDATSKQHSDPRHYERSNGVQYSLRCYVQTALRSTSLWTIQWCLVFPEMLRPNSTQIPVTINDPMVSSTPWDATSKQHSDPRHYEQSNGVQYSLRCYVQTALRSTSLWTI